MTLIGIKGSLNQAKGKMKQKWATLMHDDLLLEEGKEDELLGRIQKQTGETKENLRHLISRL